MDGLSEAADLKLKRRCGGRWLDMTEEAQSEDAAVIRWHAALDMDLMDLHSVEAIICLQVLGLGSRP